MDTLHTVMRSIRGETKTRRDHISVFREFLDHLDRVTRARAVRGSAGRSPQEQRQGAHAAPQRQGISCADPTAPSGIEPRITMLVAAPSPLAGEGCGDGAAYSDG